MQIEYDELLTQSKCALCECYKPGYVQKYVDRFEHCAACPYVEKVKKLCSSLDNAIDEIEDYTTNEYAKAVYDFYYVKNPSVIKNSDHSLHTFKEVFGDSFETLPVQLRNSLVGLVEDFGTYKLK